MVDIYIPKIKYPIGTKVYVHIGDVLIKGVVINQRLDYKGWERQYLVKYLKEFRDGFEHARWHKECDLSLII